MGSTFTSPLVPQKSDFAASISYMSDRQAVRVTFLDGRIYDYLGVPLYTYQNWTTSPHFDHYYREYIQGQYTVARVL